jgi:O-antigen/teichoic acid export membrane protein
VAGPVTWVRARAAGVAGGPGVLAALVAWNTGNYVFFLAAGRFLGPADFGLAAALLAVTVIVSVPGNALQYGIAHSVAAPMEPGDGVPSAVYRRAWRRSLWIAPAAAAVVAVAILIGGALDSDAPVGPMLLTLLVVIPMAPLFLSLGQLQGERRYGNYATAFALWGVPRPVFLVPLALAGLEVSAAIGATALALVTAATVAAIMTAPRLAGPLPPRGPDWAAFTHSLPPVVVGLSAVACLTNLDVVAAKLALSSDEAGYFGAEAVLGKAVIIVPQALAIVLLPRVAARRVEGGDTGRQLARAVVITLAVGGVATLLCLPLGELITRIAFGSDYVPGADLLAPLVAASTLLGLAIVLVTHHAARRDHRFVWAVGGVAVLQVVLLLLIGTSARNIIWIDVIAGVAVLVVHEAIHGRDRDGIVRGLVRLAGRG